MRASIVLAERGLSRLAGVNIFVLAGDGRGLAARRRVLAFPFHEDQSVRQLRAASVPLNLRLLRGYIRMFSGTRSILWHAHNDLFVFSCLNVKSSGQIYRAITDQEQF
jgi:hypothetical protein